MSGTLDPEYHRPEGMEMAGRVEGVRPDDAYCARLERAEEALREVIRRNPTISCSAPARAYFDSPAGAETA